MQLGDKFRSFDELEQHIKCFSKETFAQLYVRSSVSLQAARAKGLKRFINGNISVYQVRYCCIHCGWKHRNRGKGIRAASTYIKDCPFYIDCRVSSDEEHLEVVAMGEEHNHDMSEELFLHLPQNQKLTDEVQSDVRRLLELGSSKKRVARALQEETGQVILTKDLANIITAHKDPERHDLKRTVEFLQSTYSVYPFQMH
ncbi:uncharacterized protein LOC135395517 [Ornithodoros turicata]|uniref:uncharacterized protein LOC135395517 n=1 Tax=Ornithodoros turicata TaxID=34597 RepID=UPI00313A3938